MRHLILAQVVALAPVCLAGTIGGSVRGSDGTVVTSGLVHALRVGGGPAPRVARTAATAAIQSDGTFQIPSLYDGTYQICTQTPGKDWLNSCEWGGTGNTALLTPSQANLQIAIALTKGAVVWIRVNDPGQLLLANEGKTPGAHLLVGVGTDVHYFQTAMVVAQDSSARTYQLLLPFDRSLAIVVNSARFQLADANGKALPAFGHTIPILVPSGQTPPTITLSVIGLDSSGR